MTDTGSEASATETRSEAAQVDQWADDVMGLLRRSQRPEEARLVNVEKARAAKERPLIVVAGEDKRGKSSLVNALLRQPSASPVGIEVTTGTPITFFKAAQPRGFVFDYESNERRDVGFEEAQRLSTVLGNPANEHNIRSVLLGVDAPLLDRLNVVDTPGVGGLESGHAALTLQRLREADAMLFVLEAGAQIRRQELEFLEKAARRIYRVIFAFTKVDTYRGWQQIAEDNRRILQEKAPRFAECPVVPVSSLIALRALAMGEAGEQLREESGLAELERVVVQQVVDHADDLRLANLLQAGLAPLAALERTAGERAEALASPEATQDALVEQRQRLVQLSSERAEWPQTLQIELRRLALDRSEEISRAIIEIRSRYEERLKKVKAEEHETLPGEFVAELTALGSQVNEWTEEALMQLVLKLIQDIDKTVQMAGALSQLTYSAFGSELASSLELGDMSLDTSQRIGVAQAYMSGHSAVSMIAVGGLSAIGLGLLALPLGILAGGAMMMARFKSAKRSAFEQEFGSWMGEQIQKTQIALTNSFMRTQIDLEASIREVLRKAFTEREAEVNDAIATCQQAASEEKATRQQQGQQNQKLLADAGELRRAGLAMLMQVNA